MADPLGACVASLRSSNALLSSTISILDSGVGDFPRLSKVLQTRRHFELLPEQQLQDAQSSLVDSLTPEIQSMFSRVESHLDKLERREKALVARTELLEGRIGEERRMSGIDGLSTSAARSTGTRKPLKGPGGAAKKKGFGGEGAAPSREALRLRQLKRKKEGLEYAVERLNLQAGQRQRQLRMSVAAQ